MFFLTYCLSKGIYTFVESFDITMQVMIETSYSETTSGSQFLRKGIRELYTFMREKMNAPSDSE